MFDDLRTYESEVIVENPFPGQDSSLSISTPPVKGVYAPTIEKEKIFPKKRIATELIGQTLNTRSRKILGEFEFMPSGALQIGDYKNGVSGDLRISPNGITARDIAGLTTFAIDGTTGDAVFKGEVQAGSLISAEINADLITSGTITGITIQTDEAANTGVKMTSSAGLDIYGQSLQFREVTAGVLAASLYANGVDELVLDAGGSDIFIKTTSTVEFNVSNSITLGFSGCEVYGNNFSCNSFDIVQTPTTGLTADKFVGFNCTASFNITINGVNYKVPCLAF